MRALLVGEELRHSVSRHVSTPLPNCSHPSLHPCASCSTLPVAYAMMELR
jgi:hypothetical protein